MKKIDQEVNFDHLLQDSFIRALGGEIEALVTYFIVFFILIILLK